MSYDKACYDLALSFLQDSAAAANVEILAHQLAQDIQRCVEDFLKEKGL